MKNYKLERLQAGETFVTSEKGNSMVPLIRSGQDHVLEPVKIDECEAGDIVYCKVKGNFYTHLVKAKETNKGLLIGNNKGGINGWTKNVYGRVAEILDTTQSQRNSQLKGILDQYKSGADFKEVKKKLDEIYKRTI